MEIEVALMTGKQQNFKRIAEARTNKIIDMISLLGNLSNTSYYEYTDDQIDAVFDAIEAELKKTKKKFVKTGKTCKKRFEL